MSNVQWPHHSLDLNQSEQAFNLSKSKHQEQVGTDNSCSESLVEHHLGGNPASGDVYRFQTSGSLSICNQILKMTIQFMIMSVPPITLEPLELEMGYYVYR